MPHCTKRAVFVCFLFCSCALGADPGAPAPDFALPTAAADLLTLSGQRGKVVYVDFWASWCSPCLKSFPWMNEMQRRYGSRGFRIIAINVDQKRIDAERFLLKMPAQFSVVFDASGNTPRAYQIKAMPSSFLIDRGGMLHSAHTGFRDSSREELESEIKRVLDQP